jgi:putative transcriptional regulator
MDITNPNLVVKNRLKEILDSKGIKQNWLAKQVGLHRGTMNNIVANKYNTSLEIGMKIAYVLQMDFNDIFYLVEKNDE